MGATSASFLCAVFIVQYMGLIAERWFFFRAGQSPAESLLPDNFVKSWCSGVVRQTDYLLMKLGLGASDFCEDVSGLGCPDERFRIQAVNPTDPLMEGGGGRAC